MSNLFHSDRGQVLQIVLISYVRGILVVFVGALFGLLCYSGVLHATFGCSDTATHYGGRLTRNIASLPKNLNPSRLRPVLDVDLLTLPASKTLFADMPPEYSKTFYAECGKRCHPMVRAFRELGYTKVNHMNEGRLLLTDYADPSSWQEQDSWQRYSMLPTTEEWMLTYNFYNLFRDSPYMQHFYRLRDAQDRQALQKLLTSMRSETLLTQPWVHTTLFEVEGGESAFETFQKFLTKAKTDAHVEGHPLLERRTRMGDEGTQTMIEPLPQDLPEDGILMPYHCRPMTTTLSNNKKHKFDVRVYWFVATLDPLLVFYQDGFMRISKLPYDEGDYTVEGKQNNLMQYGQFKHHEGKQPFGNLRQILTSARARDFPGYVDRFQHVRNQMKEALALMVDTLAESALSLSANNDHDGWELMVADFVIEEDTLNVWLVDAHNDSDLPEDNYHDLRRAHDLYYGIGSILHEVWTKQEQPFESILPLQHPGEWELIYVGGEHEAQYKYKYEAFDRAKANEKKRRACARKTKGVI